jgi:hypothetical protein
VLSTREEKVYAKAVVIRKGRESVVRGCAGLEIRKSSFVRLSFFFSLFNHGERGMIGEGEFSRIKN